MNNTGWFKGAVIYQILIDRFAGLKSYKWEKPEFLGGNINGVISKLDYLEDLGINTIWISPFYKTSAYHGYHITDFFGVEPNFGTKADLKKLIRLIHKRKMKILADFVPNHCSSKHPFFLEVQKNKKSEYYNWFYFVKHPDKYLCFLNVKELPKINLDFRPARDYMIKAAKYWLDFGFDGYRLDHVIGPSHEFWQIFRKEIKKDFPDAILIGEAWMKGIKLNELNTINVKNKYFKWMQGSSPDNLFKEYMGELDGILDFKFQELIKDFVKNKISEKTLLSKLKKHYSKFPKDFFLVTFLDNHDTNRFLYECGNDIKKLKKAARIQFSIKQPLIIYYGTEAGMTQVKATEDFKINGDLEARLPMNWKNQNKDLFNFYKNVIKERKKLI